MTTSASLPDGGSFRHEAFLYASDEEFVGQVSWFVANGLTSNVPVLVVVSRDKIDRLRSELNRDADGVQFLDMNEVGENPARIIPVWQDFVEQHASAPQLRGIGEPITPARSADEVSECHIHESLLNVALGDVNSLWLLCPYDLSRLDESVVTEALHHHRYMLSEGSHQLCDDYLPVDANKPHDVPGGLSPRPADALSVTFRGESSLAAPRELIERFLDAGQLSQQRRIDLQVAANELLANAVRHGGGTGTMHLWTREETVVVEVVDEGQIVDPLVGRVRPGLAVDDSRGLWLANQLCELVQIRSTAVGTTVRLHVKRQ